MDSTVTTVTTHLDPVYYRVATHFPYTSVNVGIVNGQRLKLNTVNSQMPQKISMVNGQTLKRARQSIDLAMVAAVTMESMGVTPPDVHT